MLLCVSDGGGKETFWAGVATMARSEHSQCASSHLDLNISNDEFLRLCSSLGARTVSPYISKVEG